MLPPMRTLALLLALAPLASCVHPWQRELLALPNMTLDDGDAAPADAHVLESREGSAGANGAVGGGCGCN